MKNKQSYNNYEHMYLSFSSRIFELDVVDTKYNYQANLTVCENALKCSLWCCKNAVLPDLLFVLRLMQVSLLPHPKKKRIIIATF